MRGEKTIDFDFDFEVSHGGDFRSCNEIHMQEPGISQLKVHAEMKAYVSKAGLAMVAFLTKHVGSDALSDMQREAEERGVTDEGGNMSILDTLSSSLEVGQYVQFIERLKAILSNNKRLAWVDIDGDRVPLNDAVWQELEVNGGMQAVQKIMDGFMNFFTADEPSEMRPKRNGNLSSASSSLAITAGSHGQN